MTDSVGSELYKQGWVQGTYLFCEKISSEFHQYCWASSKDLSEDLVNQLTDNRNALILLSQTCDIVAKCDTEKTLEFVIARRPKKRSYSPYSLNLDARSSRFLELELSDSYWYKAEATKIIQISKQDFLNEIASHELQPQSLAEEHREVLARWRANRYMRIALPDSFNNKIKPLIDEKLFDSGLEDAGSLYLNLQPFDESENYTVRLFALHRQNSPPETYDNLFDKMTLILENINDIEGLICPFVEEENNEIFQDVLPVMRRDEVTIELLDKFIRWNFDYISLRNSDNDGIDEDI